MKNKFTEKEIRAVRGAELGYERYSVRIEVLVNGNWVIPYLVNEDKLDWHLYNREMRPTEKNMKDFITSELKIINELLDKGYTLVNYKKYEEIIDRYHNPLDYEPTTVYL